MGLRRKRLVVWTRRMKGWAPVGCPGTPVLRAAQSDVWVPPVVRKSHLVPHFSSLHKVIVQLSFPFLILSLKKPVCGKVLCLSEKHIL